MSELPKGWQLGRLGELTTKVGSGATPRGGETAYKAAGTPLIRSMNVHFDGLRRDGLAFIDDAQAKALDGVIVEANDVLLNITGASIGRVTTAPTDLAGARVNQHVAIIRPVAGVLPDFVARWLGSPSVQRFIGDEESGATRQALTKEKILDFELPVPPLNEQRRIVDKLDAVFDKSRAAKARLERLPALLEKLKRSILAAAFRGDLTKDWRAAHPDVEPASVLLERIRAERRRRWEDGLRAKGKDPKKATYEEPAAVDVAGLPELPDGWAWANVHSLCTDIVDCPHSTPAWADSATGYRCVRTTQFKPGFLDVNNAQWVSQDTYTERIARLAPRAGDVVYSREGGILGIACSIPEGHLVCLGQRMMLMRVAAPLDGSWLCQWLNSPTVADFVRPLVAGSASPHLNVGDVIRFAVPIPPASERAEIAQTLHRVLDGVASIRARIEVESGRMTRLEQAALAKAFRGELVPQDPSNEPATVLLDRIRAARADEPQRARRGRPAQPADPELFAAKPAAPRATNGHWAEAEEGEPVELVVAAFQLAPRLTVTSIGATTGLDAASVKKALKALVDGGQVRVEGKARGTAYVWKT